MTTSEWARTSISVFGGTGEIKENVDFSGATLEAQLIAAEEWLSHRSLAVDSGLESCRLFCSWTPAPDSRAMTLSEPLLRLLAAAHGTFWLDAYPSDGPDER